MTWQQMLAGYMPALVIMVTVYIAAVSNNKRIDDLRADMKDLRTDLNKRIDELRGDFKDEIKELRAEMKEGFGKLEERFAHPITRP
jgi:ElaB/YqjD/DUF883 family membrane-anchored ribosome-binding protein